MNEEEPIQMDPFIAGYTSGARLTVDWMMALLATESGTLSDRVTALLNVLEFDDAFKVHLEPLRNLIVLENAAWARGEGEIIFTPDWEGP